jgi:cellulose synthase/poly-beta-1,6-N-acetylglucosamine synthase-like glycosyltransferase
MAVSSPLPAPPFLPTVSVIIPIYNGERDLPNLIHCLLRQTYPADRVDYLLVNNGSCDRTPDLLDTAVQTAAAQGFRFQHLSETQIQSAYAARNTGIRAAKGEILAFTDADCNPQPDWLIRLVQSFQDEAVGLVAGEVTALPGTSWLEKYAEKIQLLSQKATLANAFCPYGQTANLAVRARALQKVGLFRPYMTTGGDADLCWRLQRDGHWQLHFAEEALVQHRHRSTLKELYSQWYRYGKSNRYLHQLYDEVKLTRPLVPREIRYSLSRWLLKELPLTLLQLLQGKADWLDLVMTPIGLYCFRARSRGQQESRLPEAAREIALLTPDSE